MKNADLLQCKITPHHKSVTIYFCSYVCLYWQRFWKWNISSFVRDYFV